MARIALALCLFASPAFADASKFFCRFDNGQYLDGWAKDGEILLDFDNRRNWQKAFGKVEGNHVVITEIVSGGMFVLVWEWGKHSAYGLTKHNDGRTTQGNAYCSWR